MNITIWATTIGGRPKPEVCFFPGWWRWVFLPSERWSAIH